MLTGANLYTYLQQKVGKPFSAWLGPDAGNRLFRETVYDTIENKYESLAGQKVYDELSVLLRNNKIFTPVNNKVVLVPALIFSVTDSGGVSPTVTLTTLTSHHLKVGDTITVGGISGITYTSGNFNGSWTVVSTPTANTATYIATGAQSSGGTYVANSGTVYTPTATILDYYHYETARAKFVETLTPVITGISIAADGIVTTNVRHNLREGDNITIAGVTGTAPLTTNMNAAQTVTEVVSKTSFRVGKSTLTGTYISGGTISLTHYNFCVRLTSKDKIAVFGDPSYLYPRVEFGENAMLFLADPLATRVCTEVAIDYMSLPLLEPDMRNTTTDLEKYWSRKLLYLIMDVAALKFAGQIKDQRLQQTEMMNIRDNA